MSRQTEPSIRLISLGRYAHYPAFLSTGPYFRILLTNLNLPMIAALAAIEPIHDFHLEW